MMSLINESDPCKLICASPGKNPVKKGIVKDGTSCLTGGVCVDGDCVVSTIYQTCCIRKNSYICSFHLMKPHIFLFFIVFK